MTTAPQSNGVTETEAQRDARLYAQARKDGLDCQWSTDGDALVLSHSRRPKRHRVSFDADTGQALRCPCEATMRCKHMVLAERSYQRVQAVQRRSNLLRLLKKSVEQAVERRWTPPDFDAAQWTDPVEALRLLRLAHDKQERKEEIYHEIARMERAAPKARINCRMQPALTSQQRRRRREIAAEAQDLHSEILSIGCQLGDLKTEAENRKVIARIFRGRVA